MYDYAIEQELRKEAQGVAYLATEKATGKRVVVKVVDLGTASDKANVEDYTRMIDKLMPQPCPYLIQYYDSFIMTAYNKRAYVMEYFCNTTLREKLNGISNKNRLTEEDVVHIGKQILSGLMFLHSKGVFHGDLKPENILVEKDYTIKIAEYGFSKSVNERYVKYQDGIACYLSPEEVEGKPPKHCSELWAVGCILYEMCTGKPAFAATDQAGLLKKFAEELSPSVPKEDIYSLNLIDVIEWMLKKDQEQRYSSCDEAIQEAAFAQAEYIERIIEEAHEQVAIMKSVDEAEMLRNGKKNEQMNELEASKKRKSQVNTEKKMLGNCKLKHD